MEQPSEKYTLADLMEGIAKRKIVVRGGKRKVLFRCRPGEKKVGRSCRRIPSSQLNKLKRRAKRAARKARTKRMRAQRRRTVSLRRRRNIPKTPKR
jgi:hypothetical protein